MLGCWGWGRGGGPPERQRWGQGHDQVPLCLFQKIIVMSWQVPWILNLVMPSIPTSLPPKVKDEEETSLQPFFFFKYRDYRLVQPTSKTHCFFKKKFFFINFWLHWVYTAMCRLSRVVVLRLLIAEASLISELRLQGVQASVLEVQVHRFSCSMACGIFLDQGSNLGSNPCPL